MGNRYYPYKGRELASTTTITGTMDKSDALLPWAVNCAVDYVDRELYHIEAGTGKLNLDSLQDARTKWREVRDEAGHIGTMVHDALEEYHEDSYELLQTLELETHSKGPVIARCAKMASTLINAAIDKLKGIGSYRVLGLEVKVVNEEESYAGRFDLLIEVGVDRTEKLGGRSVTYTTQEIWLIDYKTGKSFYPEWGMQLESYARANKREVDRIMALRLDKTTLKAYWKEYGGKKDSRTREQYWQAFLGLRTAFYVLKAKKVAREGFLAQ